MSNMGYQFGFGLPSHPLQSHPSSITSLLLLIPRSSLQILEVSKVGVERRLPLVALPDPDQALRRSSLVNTVAWDRGSNEELRRGRG